MAFVHAIGDEDAPALPPFRGAELAFAAAAMADDASVTVELVPVDIATDRSALAEVVRDNGFVAAILAPGVEGSGVSRELSSAGLAVLDLSPFGRAPAMEGVHRRFVPALRAQGAALAADVDAARGARAGACLLGDAVTGDGLLRPTARALNSDVLLSATVAPSESVQAVRDAGCRVVVWDGDGPSAAEVVRGLAAAGLERVRLFGDERLRDPEFLTEAGRAAEGTVSVCGCADVSTSIALPAQRFIQDFQSEYGSPPGPYAVEAWDAAHIILMTLRGAEPTRQGVRDRVDRVLTFEGVGTVYAFNGEGRLTSPQGFARLSIVAGGRWVPLD